MYGDVVVAVVDFYIPISYELQCEEKEEKNSTVLAFCLKINALHDIIPNNFRLSDRWHIVVVFLCE